MTFTSDGPTSAGQPKKKRSWIDRLMQKDGRSDLKKEIAETEALRKSKASQHQQSSSTTSSLSSLPRLAEEQIESNFGGGWRAREELYRKKIEELTEAEIRANIQFYETSDLLVLVKNIRSRKDHAAFRILQRHLEELYLLKHILYERGFYLNTTATPTLVGRPGNNCESSSPSKLPSSSDRPFTRESAGAAARELKERRSESLHVRCEAKTTKNLAEYVTGSQLVSSHVADCYKHRSTSLRCLTGGWR